MESLSYYDWFIVALAVALTPVVIWLYLFKPKNKQKHG